MLDLGMADVFVSYARSDKPRVTTLVAAIERQGWSVWWDPEISPGEEFDRKITEAIRGAAAVLVVWSPQSVESRWVRGEAREGARLGRLVPVRIDGADIPIDLRSLHATNLDGWTGDAQAPQAQELFRALTALIGHPGVLSAARPEGEPETLGDSRPAVCVLPFANMSGDPEQEYFSDGITEDIITDLSKVSALSVVSRNSAFVYKGRPTEVRRVARELKVSHVLEGSVRKAGNRVRITAQLVDATRDHHVWAERFDRDLNDIFSLQDEISRAIVEALRVRLLPEERKEIGQRGTDSAEAYQLYQMGWQRYVSGREHDVPGLEAIVRFCLSAIEIDPSYARAWALLAVARMMLHFTHDRKDDDGLPAAEHALELDPRLAEAHSAKARILARYGRYDEAVVEFKVALRLDPESWDVNRWIGFWKMRQRQFAEAVPYYERAASLDPMDVQSPAHLQNCYSALGDEDNRRRVARMTVERAEATLARNPTDIQSFSYGVVGLAALGDKDRALQWIARGLLVDPNHFNMRYNFACALVRLGEFDEALLLLRQVFAVMDAGMLSFTRIDPDLDALRHDARYHALVAGAEARLSQSTDPAG
jgi:adenylate cyclase